jgi:hypothetical protein
MQYTLQLMFCNTRVLLSMGSGVHNPNIEILDLKFLKHFAFNFLVSHSFYCVDELAMFRRTDYAAVPFIVSPNTAALSHIKPVSAGTSRDSRLRDSASPPPPQLEVQTHHGRGEPWSVFAGK